MSKIYARKNELLPRLFFTCNIYQTKFSDRLQSKSPFAAKARAYLNSMQIGHFLDKK